jgi:hypothetical protein
LEIDEDKKSLELKWHDVYDLDIRTGEIAPIVGTTYYSKDAIPSGAAIHQEASFASSQIITTGISGNDSTLTFRNVTGTGGLQWVSFYYQNTDDMGFGDQPGGSPDRIGGAWQLRRISSVVVNNKIEEMQTLYQRDTNKGVILSTPLLLHLDLGMNEIKVGGLWNNVTFKGADIDKIVVFPPED